jgi:3',5'-nucleoside bisphosphate phosphatase
LRTDLHCHTTASDGTLPPTALVKMAHERDIGVLAITDHDTLAGHAEAIATGDALGVRIVRGIEVSALSDEGKEVHVLGYGVQPDDDATRTRIESLRDVREARAKALISKLGALGITISFERVKAFAGDGMIGRPHVARAMVEAGVVRNLNQAFDEYLGEGKAGFVSHEGLTPQQAIALIHRAHGAAVLAHPLLYKGNLDGLLQDAIAAGLDGIEAFYPGHTAEQTQTFVRLAEKQGLLVTGGSDFHGPLGDLEVSLGTIGLPADAIARLDARIENYK